jgi:peptide/nickel transport system substrate-binding protein
MFQLSRSLPVGINQIQSERRIVINQLFMEEFPTMRKLALFLPIIISLIAGTFALPASSAYTLLSTDDAHLAFEETRMGAWVDTIQVEADGSEDVVNRLESGEIDVHTSTFSNPAIFNAVSSSPEIDYQPSFGSYIELTINPSGPIFSNGKLNPFAIPRIREAMNWLIDRDFIAQEIMAGMAATRYLPINNASLDYALLAETARKLELEYAYNKEKANQVISEEMTKLGAIKTGGKWYYNSAQVEIILLIRTEDERLAVGSYVADQLDSIGFTAIRDYKTSGEASSCWLTTDPMAGCFHIYTGGWITTSIPRDLGGNFSFFYTPRGLGSPLWEAYTPAPEFDAIAFDLENRNYDNTAIRAEMMTQALALAMQDSARIWLVDRLSITPHRADILFASDLYGGFYSQVWPYTIRREDQVGGNLGIGVPNILVEPWNPLNGTNWMFDQQIIHATGDRALLLDPYTGLPRAQRVEHAEITVQSGFPVQKSLDWVSLSFADEIQVPGDAWVDWDAATQTFITASDLYPGGITALRKSVVYYPSDLFTSIQWHDGSSLSAADVILTIILQFDRAKEESAYYDQSIVPSYNAFMNSFRGVRILSINPLVIETYSDLMELDAEMMVNTWWPSYSQGPGAWHNLALGLLAEENQQAAFSKWKAEEDEIEWLDYLAGPSLSILADQLLWAQDNEYIPYAPTLGSYITAADAQVRWDNLAQWYAVNDHFWIGTGPFSIHNINKLDKALTLQHNPDFPDPATKWSSLSIQPTADLAIDGPDVVPIGAQAVFDLTITSGGNLYPNQDLKEVKYLVLGTDGKYAFTGMATPVSDGRWSVVLSQSDTAQFTPGMIRVEFVVVSNRIALPSFASKYFQTDTVTISHTEGAPGSVFTVSTAVFSPDEQVNVFVNNVFQGQVQSSNTGEMDVNLDTTGANPGQYQVTLTNQTLLSSTPGVISLTVSYYLRSDAPLRQAGNDSETIEVKGVAPIFTDVIQSHYAAPFIARLANAGITGGCKLEPPMYCPTGFVKRGDMAIFLERGMHYPEDFTPPPATGIFEDVPAYYATPWIEQLYHDGVTGGCSLVPLKYCPNINVTRGQMAIFLLRAKFGKEYQPPAYEGLFEDVPSTHFAARWIEQLYREGVTAGCSVTPMKYCPERSVTRADMAVFLVRNFELP